MSLKLEDVSFVYGAGTSSETKALNNVNLEINKGEFVAIIGHTGSGKSTLIQHFNGLEKATSGNVYYDGKNIASPCPRPWHGPVPSPQPPCPPR